MRAGIGRLVPLCLAIVVWSACAKRLPDQDLRILQASPIAKLSADNLWSDYQADRATADRKYHARAIDISGKVSTALADAPARLMFLPQKDAKAGIEARLLDDQATALLAAASAGERLTIRCFCEGLESGNVVLKSCIKP